MTRLTTEASTDTRTKILEATIAVIAEEGWAGASTRVIAERAGVNNALVHYHFRTKSALLVEATAEAMARELAEPVRLLLAAPTLLEGLRDFGAWLVDIDMDRPTVAVFAEALVQAGRRDDLRILTAEVLDDFRRSVAERVIEDQQDGTAPTDLDAAVFATAASALLDGLVVHRLVDPGLDPRPAIELFASRLLSAGAGR